MERAQDDEMNAGISLADFKIQIEKEQKELDRYLSQEIEKHGGLVARLEQQKNDASLCQQQLDAVNEQLESASEQYQEQLDNFERKKQSLSEEIGTFQLVLSMYKGSVEDKVDSQYRGKIEDFLDDGKFDAKYESRELDSFKSIRK